MARKKNNPGNQFERFMGGNREDEQIKNTIANSPGSESVPSKKDNTSVDNSIDQDKLKSESTNDIDVQKLLQYKERLQKKLGAKSLSNEEKYPQQNVMIDRNLVAAIDQLLKTNNKKGKSRKLTKKGIYNDALRMYLEIAFDMKVPSVEDEE